jgi:hypothetical protein
MLSPSVHALPYLGHAVGSEALGPAPSEDEPSTSPLSLPATSPLLEAARMRALDPRLWRLWVGLGLGLGSGEGLPPSVTEPDPPPMAP